MPNFDGSVKTIKLKDVKDEIKDGLHKVTLVDEEDTWYKFSERRQDGVETKAYQQFKESFPLTAGDEVEVGYRVVPYKNKNGEDRSNNYVSFLKKV